MLNTRGANSCFHQCCFLGRKFKTEHYSAVGCCVIKQYFSLHSVYFLHILLVLTFMAFTLILRNLFAIYFSTMPLVFTQNFQDVSSFIPRFLLALLSVGLLNGFLKYAPLYMGNISHNYPCKLCFFNDSGSQVLLMFQL